MKNILGIEQEFEGDDKFIFKTCLQQAIFNSNLTKFTKEEKRQLKSKLFDSRLSIPFNWINLNSSAKGKTSLPYITTVNLGKSIQTQPYPYHIAELGITCASYGVPTGVIITIHPNIEKRIVFFEVHFKEKEIKKIQETIRSVINGLESAQKEEALSMLRCCPAFMKKDCPIPDKCKAINDICGM